MRRSGVEWSSMKTSQRSSRSTFQAAKVLTDSRDITPPPRICILFNLHTYTSRPYTLFVPSRYDLQDFSLSPSDCITTTKCRQISGRRHIPGTGLSPAHTSTNPAHSISSTLRLVSCIVSEYGSPTSYRNWVNGCFYVKSRLLLLPSFFDDST